MRASSFDLLSIYNYFIPGWIDFVWIGIFLLVGVLLSALATIVLTRSGFAPIYVQLITYPLMFLPTMFFASNMSRKNMFRGEEKALDIRKSWTAKSAVLASLAMISGAVLCDSINAILPPMPEELVAAMETLAKGPIWASFLCVCVFAPLLEEWLCRGIVLRGLLGKIKPIWTILISSLFFGLIHANLWQGIPAFVIALLLGYVYHKTGSLKLTILMHAVNNALSLTLMNIPAFQAQDSLYDVLPTGWYIGAICLSVMVLTPCIYYFSKVEKTEEVTEL